MNTPIQSNPSADPSILPPGWIAKPEAVKLVGVHVKHFESLVRSRQIETRYIKAPGKRDTPIYLRSAIEMIHQTRPVLRGELAPTHGALAPSHRAPAPTTAIALREIPGKPEKPAVPVYHKHLLTMGEAIQLGYPRYLLEELRTSEFPPGVGGKGRRFRFSADRLRQLFTV